MAAAQRRRRSGFTLVEVLLVLVIVGVLATVLMTTIGGQQDKAEINLTKTNIKRLADKVNTYRLNVGHYPSEGEGGLQALITKPNYDNEQTGEKWAGPYIDKSQTVDPWGNTINYEVAEAGASVKFKLWSNGPDGQSNTADDIKNWDDESS